MAVIQMGFSLRESWNKISEDYQRRSKIGTDDIYYGDFILGEKQLKLLGKVKGKRILEIGCGGGQNSIVLAKQGASVSGVDFSEKQIAYAKALAKKEKVQVDFKVGDMQNLSQFSDNTFDVVLTTVSFLYVKNLSKTMSESNRVLKRGGVFLFSEGHPMAEGELIRHRGRKVYAISNYFRRRKIFWEDQLSNGTKVKMHSYHRPLQDYFDALLQNGFSIERYLEPQRLPKSRLPPREKEKIKKSSEARKDYESMKLVPFWFIIKARKI